MLLPSFSSVAVVVVAAAVVVVVVVVVDASLSVCSTSLSGGNQVDGLPPASSPGEHILYRGYIL